MFKLTPTRLAAAYYFLYFAAAGSLISYLNLYYERSGITTGRIGILAATSTALTLVAGPLWNAAADMFRLHHRLLPLLMLATLPMIALLAAAQGFGPMLLGIALVAVCLSPVVALADHAVLGLLGDRTYDYGRLRLWGAVGWGVGAWLTGRLIEMTSIRLIFLAYSGFMLVGALVAARLPAPRVTASVPYWTNLHRFITNGRWMGFLFSIFLLGTALAIINNYLVLYMTDLGASEGLFGLLVAASSVSEMPMFVLVAFVLRKRSPYPLMIVAFLALAVRCFLYAAIDDPHWAILGQLLHGLTFSTMWAAGVNHAYHLSPEGLGASAQSLFGATMFGVAGVSGALIGSRLYDSIGPAALFRTGGAVALVGLAVFVMTEFWYTRQDSLHTQPDTP